MSERDKHRAFEKELVEKYPLLYRDMWGDARSTCMAFGIGVGEGWWPIVEGLSAKLEPKIQELKEMAEKIDDIKCEFCWKSKKWHWLRFLVGTITCFFKNLKRWPKYAWQRIKQNRKWHKNTKGCD